MHDKQTVIKTFLGLVLGVGLMTGCKTITLKEDRFFHPQSQQLSSKLEWADYQFSEHLVTRTDGTLAHGISMTKPNNQLTVMFFGGNKFSMADKGLAVIKQLSHFNANVYMFDHRGYGKSADQPTLKLLLQDAVENYDYVRSKVNNVLLLHGHSMGSFEAGWVAQNRDVDALVLESTVTHVDDWVNDLLPWFLDPFVKFNIQEELRIVNNYTTVKQSKAPLLLIVGSRDNLTPKKLSQRLYHAAVAPDKVLHVFNRATHTSVRSHPEFNAVYQSFIDIFLPVLD